MRKLHAGLRLPLLLVIVSAATLSGCARVTAIGGISTACDVWKPISWSSKDTTDTIVEVKVNNARRNGFCGVK